LAALRRLQRQHPLVAAHRLDAVIREARADAARPRPTGHRGGGAVYLDDRALLELIDRLVAEGRLVRRGRRVALAGHVPMLDRVMRERVDRLLEGLRSAGASPPRVAGIAARLGVTPPVMEGLRQAGELVSVGDGIDYPRDVYEALVRRLEALTRHGPLTVASVARELRTSRRYAEALIRVMQRRRTRTRGA
jgi:hypothetical protein